ncbi:MAG: type IV pilin N-terminal domain-containing protein [Halobacteriaceae archaeon]
MRETAGDGRGVSEFTGVAVLIGMTVLATASVGVFVLVADTEADSGPQANFSYQYISESSVLLVTHDRGDEFTARNLTLRSGDGQARWHELAGSLPNATVGPGDTVQLSSSNAYGSNVNTGDRIQVVYAPPSGNETVLSTWKGG